MQSKQVFQRERMNGHYGVTAFVISNTLSAMPFLILIAFLSGTICYFMVHLHPGFSHYLFFVLALYACITVVESLMVVIASVVPNFLMGIIIGAGIQVIYNCFAFIINKFCFLHVTIACLREYLWWSVGSSDSLMTSQNLFGVIQCLTSLLTIGLYR